MTQTDTWDRKLCLAVDAQSYGKRSEPDQSDLQDRLVRVLESTALSARLHQDDWDVQRQGDGQLIIAPLDEREPRFLDDFISHLRNELARHNRQLVPDAKLRLRVAEHTGKAHRAPNGWAGDAVILVTRLINSSISRRALRESEADLVLLISTEMYKETVLAEHTTLRPDDFIQVSIDEEKIQTDAWLWVPPENRSDALQQGWASHRGTVQQARRDVNAPAAQYAENINNVYDGVHAQNVHFGTVNNRRGSSDDD